MTMIFPAPGPLFAFQTAAIFQKGVWQRFFKDRLADAFFLPTAGPLFEGFGPLRKEKGVQQQEKKRNIIFVVGGPPQITTTGSQCLFVP